MPGTNGGNDVVLNGKFNRWADHIATSLRRGGGGPTFYEEEPDAEILEYCQEHVRAHQKAKLESDRTVMLTHPFYLHLSHMHQVRAPQAEEDARTYLDKLLNFLTWRKELGKGNIVAFETVHHYAAATSLLLEQGLIDRVVFTTYDNGTPLDTEDLKRYRRDTIFFGGGYAKRCLTSSINEMRHKTVDENLWAIRDLIVVSPYDNPKSLRTGKVNNISPKRTISLEETKAKLAE